MNYIIKKSKSDEKESTKERDECFINPLTLFSPIAFFFFLLETKNIAGQVLTYNSKNFHWLNRKTRPRMDYEWTKKTILKKKSDKKPEKKQKINVKIPHVNKNH